MKFNKQPGLYFLKKMNNYGRGTSGFETYYQIRYYDGGYFKGDKFISWEASSKIYDSKEEAQAVVDRLNQKAYEKGEIKPNWKPWPPRDTFPNQ